jgi:prepilin-type N-terminal cleavage/methylation domain-containing protein
MRAPSRRARAARSEAGVTLIEVMVTIAIMGIGFTALLACLAGTFTAGDQNRKVAVAQTVARKYADALSNATYVSCAVTTSYASALVSPPSGFTVAVTNVEYWNGDSTATFGTSPSTCTTNGDQGVQRLNLRVTQTDSLRGVIEDVLVLKRKPS